MGLPGRRVSSRVFSTAFFHSFVSPICLLLAVCTRLHQAICFCHPRPLLGFPLAFPRMAITGRRGKVRPGDLISLLPQLPNSPTSRGMAIWAAYPPIGGHSHHSISAGSWLGRTESLLSSLAILAGPYSLAMRHFLLFQPRSPLSQLSFSSPSCFSNSPP